MKINKKALVIILISVAVLTTSAVLGYFVLYKNNPSATPPNNTPTLNPSAPTQEEKDAANDQKPDNIQNEGKEESPAGDNSVTISYLGETNKVVEVNAFTSYYADGVCMFTFTKGSSTVTKATAANKDATTTICDNPLIPASEFSSNGTWTVTVSYKSNESSKNGTSESRTLTITR